MRLLGTISLEILFVLMVRLGEPFRINRQDCPSGPCINVCEGTLNATQLENGLQLQNAKYEANQIRIWESECRDLEYHIPISSFNINERGIIDQQFCVYRDEYCVDLNDTVIRICSCCDYTPCIGLCRHFEYYPVTVQGITFEGYNILSNSKCEMLTDPVIDYRFYETGHIKTDLATLQLGDYCLQEDGVLLVCHKIEYFQGPLSTFASTLVGISIVCLIATIVIFVKLQKQFHACHKFIVCYFVSLTLYFVTLLIVKRNWFHGHPIPCNLLALIYYYMVLTAFCWLFVMAYDKFSLVLSDRNLLAARCKFYCTCREKFIKSCWFSYGVPAVMVTVLADLLLTSKIRLNQFGCTFSFKNEILVFFPVTVFTVYIGFFYLSIIRKVFLQKAKLTNAIRISEQEMSPLPATNMALSKNHQSGSANLNGNANSKAQVDADQSEHEVDMSKQESIPLRDMPQQEEVPQQTMQTEQGSPQATSLTELYDMEMIKTQIHLFLSMGVLWIADGASWWFETQNFLTITLDLINCSQGIIVTCQMLLRLKVHSYVRDQIEHWYDLIVAKI